MKDVEKVEKTDVPLTISQRAERFIEMKEQLPLETSKRLTDVFIKFLTSPETSSHDRKEVFLILRSNLDPANKTLAVEAFNLDIQNLQLDIDERVEVFNLMRLFLPKRALVDVLNLLVLEITSETYPIAKRCDLYRSLKEYLTTDMCVLIAHSFLLEVQKEDSISAQCREHTVIAFS